MKANDYSFTVLVEKETCERDTARGFAEYTYGTQEREESVEVRANSLYAAMKSVEAEAPRGATVSFVNVSRNGGPRHHIGG